MHVTLALCGAWLKASSEKIHTQTDAYWILCIHLMVAYGYMNGAPNTDAVCADMFPVGHQRDAQLSEPPYTIYLSQTVYTEWEKLRVTLRATHGTFRGFMLEARRANCRHPSRHQPLGVFKLLPDEEETWSVTTMACGAGKVNNTVTHKLSRERQKVTVEWYAPGTIQGHIYFVATVVQNQTTFWTTVYSEILRDITSSAAAVICPARMLLDPLATFAPSTPEHTTQAAKVHSAASPVPISTVATILTLSVLITNLQNL